MKQLDLSNFMEALEEFTRKSIEAMKAIGRFTETWPVYCYRLLKLQPSERYALAGYPHGKHTRGKKRWLREMKRRATSPA